MLLLTAVVVSALGLVSAYPNKEVLSSHGNPSGTIKDFGIYNGNDTKITRHRYLVGIMKYGLFHCAGSIISESWVIASADTVNETVTPADLMIVGSSKDGVTGVKYNVSQIVRHPNYGKSKMDYDIVCIQITTHFYYWHKRMVFLPNFEPSDNTLMTIAGYGYTDSSSTNRSLSEMSMIWLPKSTCKTTYKSYRFSWTDRMACADNSEGAALCSGDYGDALVVDGVIYGIFVGSGNKGFCSSSALPAIFADVYQMAAWVQSVTGAEFAPTSL